MKTKNYLFLIALIFISCSGNKPQKMNEKIQDEITLKIDEIENENTEINLESVAENIIESEKKLNEIRFENWKDGDWYDNDYFRFLRKSIDDCLKGVENEDTEHLQEYKSFLQGQFFVNHVEVFLGGGVFVYLAFLDNPGTMYEAWVYSYVEEQTVTGYSLRAFRKYTEALNTTKEGVMERMKEFPHLKLW